MDKAGKFLVYAGCAKLPFPTTDFETGRAVKPHLIGLPQCSTR